MDGVVVKLQGFHEAQDVEHQWAANLEGGAENDKIKEKERETVNLLILREM